MKTPFSRKKKSGNFTRETFIHTFDVDMGNIFRTAASLCNNDKLFDTAQRDDIERLQDEDTLFKGSLKYILADSQNDELSKLDEELEKAADTADTRMLAKMFKKKKVCLALFHL